MKCIAKNVLLSEKILLRQKQFFWKADVVADVNGVAKAETLMPGFPNGHELYLFAFIICNTCQILMLSKIVFQKVEALSYTCFMKKVFLKTLQNLKKSTSTGVSFFN